MLGILWESQGSFRAQLGTWQGWPVGKLFFSLSSSSDIQIQQVPLLRPVPTEVVATRAGSPAPGTDVPPPQQEHLPPCAPAPAPALAGEPVRA